MRLFHLKRKEKSPRAIIRMLNRWNTEKALKAVAEVTDEKKLKEIAHLNCWGVDRYISVRAAAINKLKDPSLVEKMARDLRNHCEEECVRKIRQDKQRHIVYNIHDIVEKHWRAYYS